MATLQIKTLSFNLITRADEPLEIEPHVMEKIVAALDQAARNNIDLRYGSKFESKTHDYVGVELA